MSSYDAKKTKLMETVIAIVQKLQEVTKVKLAKLVLLADLQHYREHGESITGLYYVRLRKGPVVAYFDEVLSRGVSESILSCEKKPVFIYEEMMPLPGHYYSLLDNRRKSKLSATEQKSIETVLAKHGQATGTQLSDGTHLLPAWKYAEPDEPLYIPELACNTEEEYQKLLEIAEADEDGENDVAEVLPPFLRRVL